MTNVFRLVGGIFALVGAAMLAISLFLLAQRNEASRDDLRTAGVVHALAPGRDQDGGVTYTAIVRFADRQADARISRWHRIAPAALFAGNGCRCSTIRKRRSGR